MTLGLAFNYTLAPGLSGFYRSTFTGGFGGALSVSGVLLWINWSLSELFMFSGLQAGWVAVLCSCKCLPGNVDHSCQP